MSCSPFLLIAITRNIILPCQTVQGAILDAHLLQYLLVEGRPGFHAHKTESKMSSFAESYTLALSVLFDIFCGMNSSNSR